jgi:hypothetical protein
MTRFRYETHDLMRRGGTRTSGSSIGALWTALVLVSVGLLVLSALNHTYIREVRWRIAEFTTPILTAILVPLEPIREFGRSVTSHFELAEEVDRLRAENQPICNGARKSWNESSLISATQRLLSKILRSSS